MAFKEKINLLKEIIRLKSLSIPQTLSIMKECLKAYIYSYQTFGSDSIVTKEIVSIWDDFKDILKEEHLLLDYLYQNKDIIDFFKACTFIDRIELINEDTIEYYLDSIENMIVACDMQTKWRAKREVKSFLTLTEDTSYREELYDLTLTHTVIKDFFNYPNSFFEYMNSRTWLLDSMSIEEMSFCGINVKEVNNSIADLKLFVPKIIDLETAIINIHEYRRAYEIYKRIGKEFSDTKYIEEANQTVEEFKKEYILKRSNEIITMNY